MTAAVDLLVRGTMVNVFTGNLEERAIAVDDGEIVGFGDRPANAEYEAAYVAPGLINSHMHVESTMLSLPRYAEGVLPHGVTGIVADPHEIGNVLGVAGIHALLAQAERTPLRARFTVPSSVPASDLQDAGATIDAADTAALLDEEHVVGLAEVMDVDGVLAGDEEVHAKIAATRCRGLTVDGHLPRRFGAELQELCRYLDTAHESRVLSEAREKAECGMRIHLREGSSSKNLGELMALIDAVDSRRLMLCTDNFYIDDLVEHAGIDDALRRVIAAGTDPVEAVQLATINVAETYGLDVGAIQPGAPADLVLLDDLETWAVDRVVVDGVVDPLVAVDEPPAFELDHNTVSCPPLSAVDFVHPDLADGERTLRVIDHTGEVTTERIERLAVCDGLPREATEADVLPLAVIERHSEDDSIGTGFVHGFGIDRGAMASTVAHDAHNLVVVGTDYLKQRESPAVYAGRQSRHSTTRTTGYSPVGVSRSSAAWINIPRHVRPCSFFTRLMRSYCSSSGTSMLTWFDTPSTRIRRSMLVPLVYRSSDEAHQRVRSNPPVRRGRGVASTSVGRFSRTLERNKLPASNQLRRPGRRRLGDRRVPRPVRRYARRFDRSADRT